MVVCRFQAHTLFSPPSILPQTPTLTPRWMPPGEDFSYRPEWWYNQTFTVNSTVIKTSTPADVFNKVFTSALNVRWAGIRKPRTYSNIDFCNRSHWLLPDSDSVGAGGNNWNYSIPEFIDW